MNRERVKELLPVFEAFANGEDIQFRPYQYNPNTEPPPDWSDLPTDQRVTMTFPCEDYEYRIKPSPREWWINPDTDPDDSAGRLHKQNDDCLEFGCVKVREVW